MAANSATPGAGWSHRRGAASPFVLKQLSERVWHVVEDVCRAILRNSLFTADGLSITSTGPL